MNLFKAFTKGAAGQFFNRASAKAARMPKTMAGLKPASIFKKATTAARYTFTASNLKQDYGYRAVRAIAKSKAGKALGAIGKFAAYTAPKAAARTIVGAGRAIGPVGLLSVGAVAMIGVGIMRGMNNAAKDYVLERYMADQRFARDILLQSRVGVSMGTNKMNRMGSTMGLSNALSRTRHGASY